MKLFFYNDEQFFLSKGDNMHYDLQKTLEVSNTTSSMARVVWVGSVVLL
ncbi:MAG: hypothetical protein ACNYPE_17770 [Candidatus Azotimanducaceae bacterium WSBS_2022_MAG_OTU7]